jgi:hypothetical protein
MTENDRDDENATAAVVGAEDGERPAEDPGQGVVRAFGRQLKLQQPAGRPGRDSKRRSPLWNHPIAGTEPPEESARHRALLGEP